jgi:RNA polymerase sigma-70 factor (ECF subfamily)
MKDEEIIDLYFKRDELAIEETDAKYGNYLEAIAVNILDDELDAEECLNDTYLKTWDRIPPTRPRVFKAFLAKITRELAFDKYRAARSKKRGNGVMHEILDELEECIPAVNGVEQAILGKELECIIADFVGTLPKKDAYIFLSRYFYAEDITAISKKYGMSKNNVSVTLSRLRSKLQTRLLREGYLVS